MGMQFHSIFMQFSVYDHRSFYMNVYKKHRRLGSFLQSCVLHSVLPVLQQDCATDGVHPVNDKSISYESPIKSAPNVQTDRKTLKDGENGRSSAIIF